MSKITKKELLALVTKICDGQYNTEEERDHLVTCFENNVLDPEAANLIFHHQPELTPEEIVDKALSYKPIILGPPAK